MSMTTYTPDANALVHKISVDFNKRSPHEKIYVVQYDDMLSIIALELYNNEELYTIPENANSDIRWVNPDLSIIKADVLGCDADRHIIYVEITRSMVLIPGETDPVIELTLADGRIHSGSFHVVIERNPIQDSDIELQK